MIRDNCKLTRNSRIANWNPVLISSTEIGQLEFVNLNS